MFFLAILFGKRNDFLNGTFYTVQGIEKRQNELN